MHAIDSTEGVSVAELKRGIQALVEHHMREGNTEAAKRMLDVLREYQWVENFASIYAANRAGDLVSAADLADELNIGGRSVRRYLKELVREVGIAPVRVGGGNQPDLYSRHEVKPLLIAKRDGTFAPPPSRWKAG